ncbi:MFS transporter [candidate division KSB3 bacterium]|uniref:MFS transporter n=1 Tax=candidate division KSB3 bacterium TaxID=2044937 RepID=A0A9D5JZJ4_9BACT|nr:MFS transporter [candidate division KSB3 bacterium]MBD3327098.1 MFS transporter [candidate division KSB3 bacterium]
METSTTNQEPQAKGSIKFKLIISAVVLLLLALGFNALLSLNSLEKLYVESIASQYSAIGKDLQRNLERSLRFGKSITKFIGMEKILEETKRNITREIVEDDAVMASVNSATTADISVSVALPEGEILYSTDETLVNTTLPQEAQVNYADASTLPTYIKHEETYITPLPIRDMKQQWVATAIIAFHERQVRSLLTTVRDRNIKMIALIVAGSIVVLLLLFRLMTPSRRIEINVHTLPQFKRKLYISLFLVIALAQIIFSGWNTNDFKNYYLQINKQKTRTLTALLKEDIEFLFSKGIDIRKLVKMDQVLGEIITASPELQNIVIVDQDGTPLYGASKDGVIDFQSLPEDQQQQASEEMRVSDPAYQVRLELLNPEEKVEGYISAHVGQEGYISTNLSKQVIFAKLFEIGLDSATVLVISMLFFIELLILIFQFIERQAAGTGVAQAIDYRAIRPATFLFFFGIDISITFLPLYMERLYTPFFGLSKEMIIALPISAEMLFAGISVVIAGIWLDRRGWHKPFLWGLLLSSAGYLYSWIAPDALHFVISRGVVGIGYGLALMAAQGFVVQYTDEKTKAQGLTQLFAGLFAGSICGGAAGAILAERLGYSLVFFIGAVMIFLVITYAISFMRHALKQAEPQHHEAAEVTTQSFTIGQLFRFLFNRNVLSLVLFSSFPGAIALVGFINYFCPVYLNRIGASQSNIGRVYMLYGICLIYLAPFISKYVDASSDKKKFIILSGVLTSLAFTIFYFSGGIAATASAVLILGLSDSIGSGSRSAYALKLEVTRELGEGKAIGVFSTASKIGQVIAPILFGWLVVTIGIQKGITYFGLAYLCATALFLLVAQQERKAMTVAEERPL